MFITNRGVVYGPEHVILGLIYFEEKEPTTKMGNIISEMSRIQTNNPTRTPQANAHTSLSFKHQYVFKH